MNRLDGIEMFEIVIPLEAMVSIPPSSLTTDAGIVALLYRVHGGRRAEIAGSFHRLAHLDRLAPIPDGSVIAVAVFQHDDIVVLAVQHDGRPDAEAIAVAATRYEPALHLTEPWAAGVTMRRVSQLSAAQT